MAKENTNFSVVAGALYDFQEATGCSAAEEASEDIAKKDAALDACAKDAARYRFIRSATAPVYVEWYEVSKADAYLANEELDATIDAAITQAQEARKS